MRLVKWLGSLRGLSRQFKAVNQYFPSIWEFNVSAYPYFIGEDAGFPNMTFDGFFLYLDIGKKPEYENTGKYLFFCSDNRKLFDIAVNEIMNHGFIKAQLVMRLDKGFNEYVLFLHYHDDSRSHELFMRNKKEHHVKFRGWKSYAETNVSYSEGYLKKIAEMYGNDV